MLLPGGIGGVLEGFGRAAHPSIQAHLNANRALRAAPPPPIPILLPPRHMNDTCIKKSAKIPVGGKISETIKQP
jgi:hypothetical protein